VVVEEVVVAEEKVVVVKEGLKEDIKEVSKKE